MNNDSGEIRRGVTHLARRLRAAGSADGISTAKLSILSHLARRGAMTPGQLAAAEFVQPQSLTRVLAELERAAFIVRSQDESDRRRYLVSIAPEGRVAMARDVAGRDEWLAQAMTDLSPTECDVLRLAARLMEQLADVAIPHEGFGQSAKPGALRRMGGEVPARST